MRMLGIIFYSTVLILIGLVLITFSLNIIHIDKITNFLAYLASNLNARLIVLLSGVLLILISLSLAQLITGRIRRERTIAFTNQAGQVTIALSAVEDLIKRLTVGISEIKELRPNVIATKKGIDVDLRVILRSETNIPDLTYRLQGLIRDKIQEVLGIEGEVNVRIHIAKIIAYEEKDKRRNQDRPETPIPFGGYGRV